MFCGIKCKLKRLFLSKRKRPHPSSPAVASLVPASRFLIGAALPTPLTHTPDPSNRRRSALLSAKGLPLSSSTSDGILPKRMHSPLTTLDLIHFCLSCMTPRRITLKDSVYSLHSFLKGTYQGLGKMTESVPVHSPLPLRPPIPHPQGLTETLPFSQCRDQELQVAVDTGTQYNQISAGCLSRLG